MKKIIDSHSHLGDILYGRNITFKQNVRKRDHHNYLDIIEENMLELPVELTKIDMEEFKESTLNEEQARNNTATLQNMQKSLDENGISQAWVLPVLPHVGFEEILAASKLDNRIIPFTCIDFSLGNDAGAELLKDSEKGAMGLKIHPILQRKSMLSDEVHEALKAWEITKKPVICHTYPFAYFHPEESFRNIPEFGSNYDFLKLADKFPSINFVAAHSGGTSEYEQLYEGRGMKNVYVDTSFQSAAVVKEFIRRFGEDRVLFGSDWPWGKQNAPVKVVEKACDGDKELEAKVFYKNAERLIVKTEREVK